MKVRRSVLVALTAGSLALSVTACGSSGSGSSATGSDNGGSSAAEGTTVSLKSLQFSPATLTVKAGTKVTWKNDEPITHTVTSGSVTGVDPSTGLRSGQTPDGMFDGKLSSKGSTFSYTFTKAGTYSYYCSIHDGMNAKVVVTP
jgi:plastocyanin